MSWISHVARQLQDCDACYFVAQYFMPTTGFGLTYSLPNEHALSLFIKLCHSVTSLDPATGQTQPHLSFQKFKFRRSMVNNLINNKKWILIESLIITSLLS